MAHAGGAVPYLAGRLEETGKRVPDAAEKAPRGVIEYLRNFYYDTALSATPYAFGALERLVAPSQILFGSDYPYILPEFVGQTGANVAAYDGFGEAALEAIARGNALKLFPHLEI